MSAERNRDFSQAEQNFLSAVTLIAERHGGTVKIDWRTMNIDFLLPPENEVACAMELSELLGGFEC